MSKKTWVQQKIIMWTPVVIFYNWYIHSFITYFVHPYGIHIYQLVAERLIKQCYNNSGTFCISCFLLVSSVYIDHIKFEIAWRCTDGVRSAYKLL